MGLESEASEFLDLLKEKAPGVVLTGAGASVPSGIPDFRGPSGLWKKIDPKVFDIEFFFREPLASWEHFIEVFKLIEQARPNPVHTVLANLENDGLIEAIITQNIDGLHQKAGSKKVIELHGNAFFTTCLKCSHRIPTKEIVNVILLEKTVVHKGCGGLLKPEVVYFGEPLPNNAIMEAYRLAMKTRLFVVIGSSLVVYPAGYIPLLAKEHGAYLVIINLGKSALDDVADWKIEVDASLFFNEIEKLMSGKD